MDEKLTNLQIGALLHDIGKIVRRAGKGGKNRHSKAGAEYLENRELLDIEKYKEVYNMIKYHHNEEISENDKLEGSSLAYLIYEADNIASGVDRVKYDDEICDEGDKKQVKKNEGLPLNSIFNKLNLQKNKIRKNFDSLRNDRHNFNIPKEISAKQVIEFDENILVRFDKNKLTQVVISNKNTSILYNDLKLFSKDVLGELIKNEKYIERTMGYVFVDLGLAITHDMKTIYFFDQSLLPFWKNKNRPITSW